jgi:hypothetical protein
LGEAKRKAAARARAERTEINLDNLTSALKTALGQETDEAAELLILRHSRCDSKTGCAATASLRNKFERRRPASMRAS